MRHFFSCRVSGENNDMKKYSSLIIYDFDDYLENMK